MTELTIENDSGIVIQTEQWNGDLFLTISDGPEIAYEAKSILLDIPRVRKLAEWLAVWLAQHEEEK